MLAFPSSEAASKDQFSLTVPLNTVTIGESKCVRGFALISAAPPTNCPEIARCSVHFGVLEAAAETGTAATKANEAII